MRLSGLAGAGARRTTEQRVDDYPTYTELGADGLDYIATVRSTPEEAEAVTAGLSIVTEAEWADFLKA